ncbi:hypothetical protein ES332_D12G107900v1 [Gossypium tomentosum]|uniref:Uncharacterized protein n=1 Tax=Gossypium tomentosum TaxID=34277 RepID=A0A5D2I8D6_GOSTO|nr:hypothetical protein ES332_D12G107900v1 [Gossypium tomentosum]
MGYDIFHSSSLHSLHPNDYSLIISASSSLLVHLFSLLASLVCWFTSAGSSKLPLILVGYVSIPSCSVQHILNF